VSLLDEQAVGAYSQRTVNPDIRAAGNANHQHDTIYIRRTDKIL
jgi:hypothetical protein